jgi:hypothetical protein
MYARGARAAALHLYSNVYLSMVSAQGATPLLLEATGQSCLNICCKSEKIKEIFYATDTYISKHLLYFIFSGV